MKEASERITNALLKHHRGVCVAHEIKPPVINDCAIEYGDLCRAAGLPELTRIVGTFLQETAEWCQEQGYPPPSDSS